MRLRYKIDVPGYSAFIAGLVRNNTHLGGLPRKAARVSGKG